MARSLTVALVALLAAAPGGARAQFWPSPMIVRLPYTDMDVLAGQFAASSGDGLLLLQQGIDFTEQRPWHDLLRRVPSSFPVAWTSTPQYYRSGYLSQNGADALVDVATPTATGVAVVFGSDPATVRPFATSTGTGVDSVASFLRLLPKTSSASGRVTGELVVPILLADPLSRVMAVDFDTAAVPASTDRWWPTPVMAAPSAVGWHEAFPVRISAAARGFGIDDVAVGVFGGALLLMHAETGPPATLADIRFQIVQVGAGYTVGVRPSWLPSTVNSLGDALGVTALDVNLDGAVDLVFTNATAFGVPPLPHGALIWVEGTGNPADFADPTLTPWHDLGADPALGLVDPLIVRGLDIGGQASFAVWDRALQEVVVVTPDSAAAGGFRVWRAPAPGQRAVDIFLADLVGSPSPDLVVVMSNPQSLDTVLVYPDAGDAPPVLAWAPGSPGAPARGMDHPMAVSASDPDGPAPLVDWLIGDPAGTPVAQGTSYTYPGTSLCTLPPPDLAVTVRATDDRGVFTELGATLPVALLSPAISIASPSGRLVLPPGGATAVLEGTVGLACGAQATWGGNWPAGATFVDDPPQGSTVRRTVTLGEATYPELLARPTVVTLTTTDPVPVPVSTLTVDLDASGLVEVQQVSDLQTLAAGDVAVLRTHVESRVGVPIPMARVVDVLGGLTPAGSPRVSGATVVDVSGGGAEVVVDALPAWPGEVEIDLPVSSLGGPGASSVEVRSSGGYLLTPAAAAAGKGETPLGCGCGSSPGGALALAALLVLVRGRRRVARRTAA